MRRRLGYAVATLGALLGGCGDSTTERPTSVLLVTLDTLRADHVGAYGADGVHTPRLDRMAREGTLFEHAAAPMPLTRPSHFSILTSRYPREHGVLNNAMALPESAQTLTEILRAEGLRTAAFVGVKLLSRESGAGQGFEEYDAPRDQTLRAADRVVAEALRWAAALQPGERYFLWVHLFDPHLPYAPPAEFLGQLDGKLATQLPEVDWKHLYAIAQANAGDIPQRVFDHARELYRGDVEYTDLWVGHLLDGLAEQGHMQDTLTIITADHGESFEHGVFFEHADCLHDGAIRIPMIVHAPGFVAAGRRIATQCSAIDVAPTVLDALGLTIPARFSGQSLLELPAQSERYVLIQHPFYQPGAAANRSRKQAVIRTVAGMPTNPILTGTEKVGLAGVDWKFVRTSKSQELYRMGDAPDEANEVGTAHAAVRTQLDAALSEQLRRHALQVIDATEINAELRETLRALGYVDEE